MEEGTITAWVKREGDHVAAGDVLCEVETDKATMEYESTQDGTLLKILVDNGSTSAVGEQIAIVGDEGDDVTSLLNAARTSSASGGTTDRSESTGTPASGHAAIAGAPSEKTRSGAAAPGAPVRATPVARKIAAERSIDLALVNGTGPGGRVTKRDVLAFHGVPVGVVSSQQGGAPSSGTRPHSDTSIPTGGRRAMVARRLAESKFTAPHYYLRSTADMSAVISARSMLNAERNEKVSLNAFLIKLCAEALKRHPQINASWQGETIVQFGSIDIGLAVDRGSGLIAPIVRDAGSKGVLQIDDELQALIAQVDAGGLKPSEYTGATFTISNLGSFGIEEFTAIINPPGSAILAVGETKKRPVVSGKGEVVVRPVMTMTLSCDHRVIDGAAGGRFLSELQRMIEVPARALF